MPGGGAIPVSRRERFKQRAQQAETPPEAAPPVAHRSTQRAETTCTGIPTQEEEMSAVAFLGAVKVRLADWGKVDQYHEFVHAVSGSVDVKAAVRILRGHDDLLRVFRSKFAPSADILAVKAELHNDDLQQDGPHPPRAPHPSHRSGEPNALGVKVESYAHIKEEHRAPPRPPALPPGMPRGVVTVGDDSDDEMHSEASIGAAVRKGRSECIAQLGRLVFQRTLQESVQERLAMVQYATRITSKPRFPRELHILRGPAGIGKSEYAQRILLDLIDFSPQEGDSALRTHVCSVSDFLDTGDDSAGALQPQCQQLELALSKNDARLRFALEAGVNPVFVDWTNSRLWEMRSAVLLADRLGYVTHVVDAAQICDKWSDVDQLLAMDPKSSTSADKGRALKSSLIAKYEPLQNDADPLGAIRASIRSDESPFLGVVEAAVLPTAKPSSANWIKTKQEVAPDRKRPGSGPLGHSIPSKAPKRVALGSKLN